MHNPTSVLQNDTHKLLKDFDIQTDQLTSARRPELITINNKKKKKKKKRKRKKGTCKIVNCPGWPQIKIERKWKEGLVPGPC